MDGSSIDTTNHEPQEISDGLFTYTVQITPPDFKGGISDFVYKCIFTLDFAVLENGVWTMERLGVLKHVGQYIHFDLETKDATRRMRIMLMNICEKGEIEYCDEYGNAAKDRTTKKIDGIMIGKSFHQLKR